MCCTILKANHGDRRHPFATPEAQTYPAAGATFTVP
jgi:hypothetical protein